MIEQLQEIDVQLFTLLNGGHTPFLDEYLWMATNKLAWVLPIVALLVVTWRHGWRATVGVVLAVALTITIADQVSSSVIKQAVERLRPSHNPALEATIQLVNGYRGGMYGFVSSHAANAFGAVTLLGLMTRGRWLTLVLALWAMIVTYSRIYLGVHYPGDIVGGAIVGALAACLVYWLWKTVAPRVGASCEYTPSERRVITAAVALTAVGIAVIAGIILIA